MPRTHDMGGRATDEPLNTQEHALADWEVLADAVTVALGHKGIRWTDESRRATEDLPAEDYLALG
jgi:Nitrile hydratase beta subunit, N-terminal